MKRKPQNAQRSEKKFKKKAGQDKGGNDKKERRVAPEFTLNCSDGALEIIRKLPESGIKTVKVAAYQRIHVAEAALCGALRYVTITSMEQLNADYTWWTPFQVTGVKGMEGRWLELEYRDTFIREYVLQLASGPDPDRPKPKMRRQQAQRARKRKAQDGGPKGGGGAKSARAARVRRQLRRTDTSYEFAVLYRFARSRINNSLVQLQRALMPRLLRSVVRVKHSYRNAANTFRAVRARLIEVTRAGVRAINVSFTGAPDVSVQEASLGARLELRRVGRNVGPVMFLYSWIRDEAQPGGWPADWFGADWPADWFGILPEEERAFI